jgi:DNA invertase Pin-like site-specific DNA recombinase
MSNTMPTQRPKAYSYLRFSTPEQLRGDSLRRQTTMAQEYAARHGLDLDTELTFHDLGVSAFKGANAESGKLAYFKEAVEVGLVKRGSILLVEALDRLSRLTPLKAIRVLEDIVESGISVVTLNDGKTYTAETLHTDQTSLLIAVIMFMRANDESVNKARRVRAAWEGKRLAAGTRPLTAAVPAWLRLDRATGKLEVIPERQRIVRRIFAEYLAGRGHHAVADSLNADGVPCFGEGTRQATHWHRTYIRKILGNPSVFGVYVPHTYVYEGTKRIRKPLEPIADYYPPVVTKEAFDEVRATLGTAVRAVSKAGAVANIFGGLALCPSCGATMTRVYKGPKPKAGRPKLVCTRAKAGVGCEYRAVDLESVEAALVEKAGQFVGEAPSGDEDLDDRLAQVLTGIDELDSAIANVVKALERRPSAALSDRLAVLERERAATHEHRDVLLARAALTSGAILERRLAVLGSALHSSPLDRSKVNVAMRAVLAAVVVDYRHGELVLRWKHGGESRLVYAFPMAAAALPACAPVTSGAAAARPSGRRAPAAP